MKKTALIPLVTLSVLAGGLGTATAAQSATPNESRANTISQRLGGGDPYSSAVVVAEDYLDIEWNPEKEENWGETGAAHFTLKHKPGAKKGDTFWVLSFKIPEGKTHLSASTTQCVIESGEPCTYVEKDRSLFVKPWGPDEDHIDPAGKHISFMWKKSKK